MMAIATQVFAQKATIYTTTDGNPWVSTHVRLTETMDSTADITVYADSLLQLVLVVYNPEATTTEKTVCIGSRTFALSLKGKSINTIVVNSVQSL